MLEIGMRSGRTQRMLKEVFKSTAKHNVVVAHSQEYANELRERFDGMLMLDDIKGRTFLFIGASSPDEAQHKLRGGEARFFYDHYFWNLLYQRKVAP